MGERGTQAQVVARLVNYEPTPKNADDIRSMSVKQNYAFSRSRREAAPRLKDALYKWICAQSNLSVLLNADIFKMHGRKLMYAANELLPECEQLSLKFSKGWIERFKKRFGLRFRQVHGEAMGADVEKLDEEIPCLKRIIMLFDERET